MNERLEQIIRLLDTRNDNLPLPTRRETQIGYGFVHDTDGHESCPDCLANDRVMFGCETCRGSGYVVVKRERDPYAQDKVLPYGFDVSLHERRREREAELARLAIQLQPPRKSEGDLIAEANAHPYGWEVARKAMYRDYDYRALDVALDQLRSTHPGTDPYCDFGLVFLSTRLPHPLRAPESAKDSVVNAAARGRSADPRAIEQRDDEIRRLIHVDGVPSSEVAAQFNLSVSQVNRISKILRSWAA